ncbi:CHAP domain-containing protein [Rhodococcus sp. KBS0724]|uniref:CHAP domain-containing protein n=1 Tax=Rhodococcus sp. KBS0724 TaxID=1179674 RepID=UPI00110E7DCC|nr:CHAP domain-containing protein [Rhodococcus sp. KBS0724]TSD44748.1 CHAP domain-containing protein [Rhodococcus sp. KBS0724]
MTVRTRTAALALAASGLVLTGLTALNAPEAAAAIRTGKVIQQVNVRNAPNTNGPVVRTIPAGTNVGINCWVPGQAITGPYRTTSTIWYTIDGGGYVTDSYLETGSNAAVTPRCSAPALVGGRAMGRTMTVNDATPGQCTWGAKNYWKQATGYYPNIHGDAKAWANDARANGWTVVADAQARSIVVFQPGVHGADRNFGHVGWVDSVENRADGRYIRGRDMNGYGNFVLKDVPGMSYILAP